jgi:hypothetical protein
MVRLYLATVFQVGLAELLHGFWTEPFHLDEVFMEPDVTMAVIRIQIVRGIKPNDVEHLVPNKEKPGAFDPTAPAQTRRPTLRSGRTFTRIARLREKHSAGEMKGENCGQTFKNASN